VQDEGRHGNRGKNIKKNKKTLVLFGRGRKLLIYDFKNGGGWPSRSGQCEGGSYTYRKKVDSQGTEDTDTYSPKETAPTKKIQRVQTKTPEAKGHRPPVGGFSKKNKDIISAHRKEKNAKLKGGEIRQVQGVQRTPRKTRKTRYSTPKMP